MRLTQIGTAWALLCSSFWFTPTAAACGNEVDERLHDASRDARSAERLANRGRLNQALRLATQARQQALEPPSARAWQRPVAGGQPAVITRIDRILAVVVVRLGGGVNEDRSEPADDTSEAERQSHLEWATQVLADQLRRSPGDPLLIARAAEALLALGRVGEHTTAALQSLADRDLMPDTQGFATLAGLHARLGNEAAHDAAIALCHERANRRERSLCRSS